MEVEERMVGHQGKVLWYPDHTIEGYLQSCKLILEKQSYRN